ncbi:MAG TPA: carboxypeptidase-like regulatory domain-containing protein [Kofleriaceae bacterium]|nr:carboxypeptidase-like regulatory domain-containing protein [Kofleriaceae bacterium]
MRALLAGFAVLSLVACGPSHGGDDGDDTGGDDGGGGMMNNCVGIECQIVDCAKDALPPTTLTGTVFAPNGTLPLYGVNVYVPRDTPLPPFTEGAQCSRCSDALAGNPVARVQTDETGKFRLENLPAGDNIPLVITSGKWRRQLTIPRVEPCAEAVLPAADTRLPKNKSEGDIPKIALTTGDADSLECLIRKMGIDDSEVTTDAGTGRVHFYRGDGVSSITGSGTLANATTLWGSATKLDDYDIVFFSCEGAQNANTKSQAAMDAVKAYADLGGRVFASHWHNIWIEGATTPAAAQRPSVWTDIATWTNGGNTANPTVNLIDEDVANNKKGKSFADWMVNVGGSTVRGEIPLVNDTGKTTVDQVKPDRGERWTYLKNQGGKTQNFQFTTPNEMPLEARCGKVVFSDMHVSGNPNINSPYPSACALTPLTPQEKALAFMFFDIASCVGGPIF